MTAPLRVLVLAGSGRRQYNCPGVDGKARTLMLRLADRLPAAWTIDLEDLGNVYGRPEAERQGSTEGGTAGGGPTGGGTAAAETAVAETAVAETAEGGMAEGGNAVILSASEGSA